MTVVSNPGRARPIGPDRPTHTLGGSSVIQKKGKRDGEDREPRQRHRRVVCRRQQRLTQLKELDAQGQAFVQDAAVVARGDDGRIEVKDEVSDEMLSGTAGGGVIGLLIGILGGPLGVLIGGTTGMLVGSFYGIDDADKTDSVLSQISTAVRPGHTALLAQVTEQSPR